LRKGREEELMVMVMAGWWVRHEMKAYGRRTGKNGSFTPTHTQAY
jgi:hypothetical protein